MRPLARPPPDMLRPADHPAASLGLFGPYCAFSERPLRDVFALWSGPDSMPPFGPEADWNAVLPIDPTTLEAALLRLTLPSATEPILRPDRDDTFSLTGDSPFTYDLEQVRVWYLDDEGAPEGEPTVEEHVIVRGRTDRAQATVRLFALNSIYYDEHQGELRIPRSAYLRMDDSRLQERTAAWLRAEEASQLAAQAEGAFARTLLLDQIRVMASMTGFWSVWATVFWNRFEDLETVRRVTIEPARTAAADGGGPAERPAPALSGPGPHNAFPGTRADGIS